MRAEVDGEGEVVLPFPFDHFFFCFFAEPPAAGAMLALVLRRSGWESELLVMGSREWFRERER
jgi:hypothetical protein